MILWFYDFCFKKSSLNPRSPTPKIAWKTKFSRGFAPWTPTGDLKRALDPTRYTLRSLRSLRCHCQKGRFNILATAGLRTQSAPIYTPGFIHKQIGKVQLQYPVITARGLFCHHYKTFTLFTFHRELVKTNSRGLRYRAFSRQYLLDTVSRALS